MGRLKFDIKYRPQIESGEYKVETKAGCPVRIVCWDMACELPILGLVLLNDEKAEEVAVGFTNEGTNLLGEPLYDKLFIVTPEEEMTDFEKKLWEVLKSEGSPIGPIEKFTNADKEVFRSYAAKLLSLAREQLQPEIDAEIEKAYKNADKVMYQKGKEDGIAEARNDISARVLALKQAKDRAEEALKDLPRWKRCAPCEEDKATIPAWIVRFDADRANESAIVHDDYYICFGELEKLPGFKEK